MSKVRISEAEYNLENGEKGKLAIFMYGGSGDPRPILDNAISSYVDDNKLRIYRRTIRLPLDENGNEQYELHIS